MLAPWHSLGARSDQPGSRESPAVRGSGASVEGTTIRALACAVLAAAISGAAAGAQELPPQVSAVPIPEGQVETAVGRLDEIVADVRRRTGVPGIAVAVVSGGAVAFTKGYGVLEAGKRAPVDADTVFQLASVSKSVGATVVATRIGDAPALGHAGDRAPALVRAGRPARHPDAHDRRPLFAPLRPARPRRRRPRGHRLRPAAGARAAALRAAAQLPRRIRLHELRPDRRRRGGGGRRRHRLGDAVGDGDLPPARHDPHQLALRRLHRPRQPRRSAHAAPATPGRHASSASPTRSRRPAASRRASPTWRNGC